MHWFNYVESSKLNVQIRRFYSASVAERACLSMTRSTRFIRMGSYYLPLVLLLEYLCDSALNLHTSQIHVGTLRNFHNTCRP